MGIFSKKGGGLSVSELTRQKSGSSVRSSVKSSGRSSVEKRRSGEFLMGLRKVKTPMRAEWNGQVIAESRNCECYDGTFYFPREDLVAECFTESTKEDRDEKKGLKKFLNVVVDGKLHTNAAFYYPDPIPKDAGRIQNQVAFWKGIPVRACGDSDDDSDSD